MTQLVPTGGSVSHRGLDPIQDVDATVVYDGHYSKRRKGTPQGGPMSPLLSNILLTELDNELSNRGIRFVRYADDCSVFLKSKRAAYRVLSNITRFLERKLKLEVNEEKTSACRPVRFELLGHCFTSTYKKGSVANIASVYPRRAGKDSMRKSNGSQRFPTDPKGQCPVDTEGREPFAAGLTNADTVPSGSWAFPMPKRDSLLFPFRWVA